jgi:hypothetical protein
MHCKNHNFSVKWLLLHSYFSEYRSAAPLGDVQEAEL